MKNKCKMLSNLNWERKFDIEQIEQEIFQSEDNIFTKAKKTNINKEFFVFKLDYLIKKLKYQKF